MFRAFGGSRLPRQLLGISPFSGDIRPTRVPLLSPGSGRPTLPFPHPWNYRQPIRILDTYFWRRTPSRDRDGTIGTSRSPGLRRSWSRAIRGSFARSRRRPATGPGSSIATRFRPRASPGDGQGHAAVRQRADLEAAEEALDTAVRQTTLFQPEQFHEFAETFRHTVGSGWTCCRARWSGRGRRCVQLEPEIKAVMLEMLANNFFGAEIPYDEIRNRYVPALERVIDHIVRDTVMNKLGIPLRRWSQLQPEASPRRRRRTRV